MVNELIESLTHVVKQNKPSIRDMVVKMSNNKFNTVDITEFINKSYNTDLNIVTIRGIIKDSQTIVVSQEIFGDLNEINTIIQRLKKNLEVSKHDINMIKMYSDIIASNFLNESNNS